MNSLIHSFVHSLIGSFLPPCLRDPLLSRHTVTTLAINDLHKSDPSQARLKTKIPPGLEPSSLGRIHAARRKNFNAKMPRLNAKTQRRKENRTEIEMCKVNLFFPFASLRLCVFALNSYCMVSV